MEEIAVLFYNRQHSFHLLFVYVFINSEIHPPCTESGQGPGTFSATMT